ncbi:MAG: proprotein convertase P-domain-containing protein, partial [Bacteroidota bacterium]
PALSPASVCPGTNVSVSNGVSRLGKSIITYSLPDAGLFGGNTPVNSPVTVSGLSASLNNSTVKINYVKINITHASVGDLRIRLIAPDASVFLLSNQNGGSGDNYTNTVFKTGGTAITSGTAPFTGTYAPQQAFSNFNSINPNGAWNLNVTDMTFSLASGTLVNWEISFIDGNGISYTWTSTPAGINSTSSSITDTPSQNTSYNLVVNGPGGCSSNGSASVAMLAAPQPFASTNAPVCNGFSLALFGDNLASGQSTGNTWSWVGPSFASSLKNPTISGATGAATGTYTLNVTNSLGCSSSTTIDVAVNPNPVLTIATQTDVSCNGYNDGSLDFDASSGTPDYLYDLDFGNISLDGIYSGLAPGLHYLDVIDNNGCVASEITATITEPAVLTVSAVNNGPVCSGTTINFNSTPTGGTAGFSYSWTGPNSYTSAIQNPTINAVSTGDAGQYDLQITDAHGCIATNNTSVSVSTAATVTAGVNQTICEGSPVMMAGSFGGSASSATWSTSGSGSFSDPSPTANYTPSAADVLAGSVILTYTTDDPSGPCSAVYSSMALSINAAAIVSAGSSQTICSGSSATMSASLSGGASSATWSTSGTGSFNNNNPNAVYTPSAADVSAGSVSLTYTTDDPSGPCDAVSSSMVLTFATVPTAAVSLSGSPNKCLGQSATVALAFTGTGPWSYTISDGSQTQSGSASGNPANVNITPVTTGTHNYTVTAISDAYCPAGGTASGTATVYVSSAAPSTTAGTPVPAANEACSGSVMLITTNAIGGQNIRYSWNSGTNSSVVLYSTTAGGPFSPGPFQTTSPTVYAQFGALVGGSGYNVCVQGVNGCGSTNNRCTWIRGAVSVPGTITPAANVVACSNDVKNYSCGASGGATVYNWTLSGSAALITNGQGTQNVTVSFPPVFTTGQLCVTASLSCGGSSTSAPRCMTISNNPAVPAAMTGPAKICPGEIGVSYSVPAVTGATGYNWTIPAGTTIASGANTNAITVNFPNSYTGAPPVCVSATSACGTSVARCKAVGSNIPGQPGSVTGPTTNICNSQVQYSISNVAGASGYTWTNPAGTTIASGQGSTTILLNIGSAFTNGQLTVVATSSACTPGAGTARTITIHGAPSTPATISANPSSWCAGSSLNFSVVPVSPLPNYLWTASNGTVDAGQGSNNIDVTWGTG